MSDKVKLVLTRPALERLISDDSELEVDLRHAAVKEAFSKHLGTILNDFTVNEIVRRAKAAITLEIDSQLGAFKSEKDGWRTKLKFEPTAKTKEAIAEYVQQAVKEAVETALKVVNFKRMIQEQLDLSTSLQIKEEVKKKMAEVLSSLS